MRRPAAIDFPCSPQPLLLAERCGAHPCDRRFAAISPPSDERYCRDASSHLPTVSDMRRLFPGLVLSPSSILHDASSGAGGGLRRCVFRDMRRSWRCARSAIASQGRCAWATPILSAAYDRAMTQRECSLLVNERKTASKLHVTGRKKGRHAWRPEQAPESVRQRCACGGDAVRSDTSMSAWRCAGRRR